MTLAIDGNQLISDLEELGESGRNELGGYDRLAFSPEDLEGRDIVERFMRDAGMTVVRDAALNSVGSYPGSEDLPPIVTGSHTDSVPCGGNYDGVLGVLTGIACVRALNAAGIRLRHPIEVINFSGEEAVSPGGTFGSRLMTGAFEDRLLDQTVYSGQSFAELLTGAGVDLGAIRSIERKKGDVAAFVELHIEQGGILDDKGIPVGVVQGIVGFRRYSVVFGGVANHAGTTPMDKRDDALLKTAPFISAVAEVAKAHGIVGTVGTLEVVPNAPNVIPEKVSITFELRGMDDAVLDSAENALRQEAAKVSAAFDRYSCKPPIISDPTLVEALAGGCEAASLEYMRMNSGAGHDANLMARICPVAMLFVPNRDGISHAKEEYASPEACIQGAQALLHGLLAIDAAL